MLGKNEKEAGNDAFNKGTDTCGYLTRRSFRRVGMIEFNCIINVETATLKI